MRSERASYVRQLVITAETRIVSGESSGGEIAMATEFNRNLGRLFRQLRESKKISGARASTGILSAAQLSRAETGKSDMPLSKFFRLLEHIHVSPEELAFMMKDFGADDTGKLFERIKHDEVKGNYSDLLELHDEVLQRSTETGLIAYRLEALAIQSILASQHKAENLTDDEKEFLLSFFRRVIEWGRFELGIFSAVFAQMDYSTNLELVHMVTMRTDFYINIPTNRKLVLFVLTRMIYAAIENSDFYQAKQLLESFDSLATAAESVDYKALMSTLYEAKGQYEKAAQELSDVVLFYEKFGRNKALEKEYKRELKEVRAKIGE
jgi:Rgg/GadR/MutR family transcriptional activator